MVLTSQLFGQRISFIDKDKSNEFLFNENDPVSLVSIAKQFAIRKATGYDFRHNAEYEYVGPELISFFSEKNLLDSLQVTMGDISFEALISKLTGEDSVLFDSTIESLETVIAEFQYKHYYDLNAVNRIIVFEDEVKNLVTGEIKFEINRIGFAKKYKETGERYFITFAVNFKDLMVANDVSVRIPIPFEITKKLTDKGNSKSLISQLKQIQFSRFFADSINNKPNYYGYYGGYYFGFDAVEFPGTDNLINYYDGDADIEYYYYENKAHKDWTVELPKELLKREIKYLKGKYSRFQVIPSLMNGEDSIVVDPLTGLQTVITQKVTDSSTYWIDLDISSILFNYTIGFRDSTGKGNGVISPVPSGIKFYSELAPGLRYHFKASNFGEDLVNSSNINLINSVFPYRNSSEFPSVKFFDEYQRNKHTHVAANKKGRKYIKKNFYVNEYFKGNDPFFGQFFAEQKRK